MEPSDAMDMFDERKKKTSHRTAPEKTGTSVSGCMDRQPVLSYGFRHHVGESDPGALQGLHRIKVGADSLEVLHNP